MSGTYVVTMGDRGRIVVPAELRDERGLAAGRPMILIDTANGIVLATREQAKALVREQLAGVDLVQSLLDDRRAAAVIESGG